ncbi:MAG: reverse transcriptase domain-containing protein, partial [Verrucomicrobiota bacterium]
MPRKDIKEYIYFSIASHSQVADTTLRLASLNVNGLRAQVVRGVPKRRKIFTWLKQWQFDVVLLQETHSTAEDCDKWLNEWGGLGCFSHGDNRSRGVCTLIRPNAGASISKTCTDRDGKFVILELILNGVSFTVGNFYGPSTDNPRVIEDFVTEIDEYENSSVIFGGDFNFCLDISKDRESSARRLANNDKCKEVLKRFMEDNDLIDTWRELYPQKRCYTYVRANPPSKSRIDFFVTSKNILHCRSTPVVEIRDGYLSDHKMITMIVQVPTIDMGRSFWKFNNCLLKDENFVNMARQKIREIIEDNEVSTDSSIVLFETLVCVLRGHIIKFASRKKQQRCAAFNHIEEEILRLESISNADESLLYTLKKKREDLMQDMSSQGMFLSKVRWRHLAETGSKYFHDLHKRNRCKNVCKALFVEDNQIYGQKVITSSTEKMLQEGCNFFSKLYEKLPVTDEIEPFTEGLTRLSEEDARYLNSPIDLEELTRAVFSTNNNSSPGLSGYTGEFYKFFWPELKHLVLRVCNEIFERDSMPVDMKRSVTILIPKKGKDSRMIENLRPISLLNTLYKIITKCLASRLGAIVSNIINEDQTGFIKGRYIGENIRLLLDFMDHCNSKKKSALLLACDVRKAYDSVEWQYIKRVMEWQGLGRNFLRWIDVLYDENPDFPAKALIQINGKLSSEYKTKRGLKQGCPLSCLLFLIAFEPLLEKIRRTESIRGMEVGQTTLKVTSYADDVTIIMDGTSDSFIACLKVFDDFRKISGLELNVTKTQALWIGHEASTKRPICLDYNVQWPKDCLEILGIKISNDPNVNIAELNY